MLGHRMDAAGSKSKITLWCECSMIDSGSLFSQLLPMLWWVFALLTLASLFKSPWFKGFIGEVIPTCRQLNNLCHVPVPCHLGREHG